MATKSSVARMAWQWPPKVSKDIEKDFPGVRVTINQQAADYVVLLIRS
jgi:hypothetical protein